MRFRFSFGFKAGFRVRVSWSRWGLGLGFRVEGLEVFCRGSAGVEGEVSWLDVLVLRGPVGDLVSRFLKQGSLKGICKGL